MLPGVLPGVLSLPSPQHTILTILSNLAKATIISTPVTSPVDFILTHLEKIKGKASPRGHLSPASKEPTHMPQRTVCQFTEFEAKVIITSNLGTRPVGVSQLHRPQSDHFINPEKVKFNSGCKYRSNDSKHLPEVPKILLDPATHYLLNNSNKNIKKR